MDRLFEIESLDDEDPFEIDRQAARLFKHAGFGVAGIYEVRRSDPLFYPALPPTHWLMVAEVSGTVLLVPRAPSDNEDPRRRRPIGCYTASKYFADRYLDDR